MFEMPSCYKMEVRKARQAHKCCECHGAIQPGEVYHYHHGVWDGEAMDFKVCVDCDDLRKKCDKGLPAYDVTPFEGLIDSVNERPELFARFAEIKRKRGATVPEWMAKEVDCEKCQPVEVEP